jgi:hypothetical protein
MDQGDKNNKEIDLSNALENPEDSFAENQINSDRSKIIQWIINYSGFVKDRKQANYLLIGFSAIIIIIALFLFFGWSNNKIKNPNESIINTPQSEEGYIPR